MAANGGSEVKQPKSLEKENHKLKKLLAEQLLDNATMNEMLGKSF